MTIAYSPVDLIDYYAVWFRRYGLWDYVEDILPPSQMRREDVAIEIEGGDGAWLTAHNLAQVISHLT